MSKTSITPHIRWMVPNDMRDVLEIENAQFEQPWSEDHFTEYLRQRNCIGLVAEYSNEILGFVLYLLENGWFEILNFAVDPAFEREGIGTAMIAKLKGKAIGEGLLAPEYPHRDTIRLNVGERNLDMQYFLAAQGFEARSVIRDHYDNGDDAFRFEWSSWY